MSNSTLRIQRSPSNQRATQKPTLAVTISMLCASVVLFLPVSLDISLFRPQTVFLVALFWMIAQPKHYSIWFAFSIGLACDILLDTHVGQNALAFCGTAFFVNSVNARQENLPLLLTVIFACFAIICYYLILTIIDSIILHHMQLSLWKPLLTSFILWPIVYLLLRRYIR